MSSDAQTPNVAYREAFAFLTGTSLPPGPPLPPLPEELEDGAADLAALLVQVDRVVGELTAAGSARPEGDRLAAPEPA